MVRFLRRLFHRKELAANNDHQQVRGIAEKLLRFLREHAAEMPWGRVNADLLWAIDSSERSKCCKYFGHYQNKTRRIELKFDSRDHYYQLTIRYQNIVNGQMRLMTKDTIDTRQYYQDKKLKQVFEEMFSIVETTYRERAEAAEAIKAIQRAVQKELDEVQKADNRETLQRLLDDMIDDMVDEELQQLLDDMLPQPLCRYEDKS